jgi:hypothetical protein
VRVVQEFYCNKCNGYFRVTLNMALNIRVLLECPECHRQHERDIKDGVIREVSKEFKTKDIVIATRSTYSKTPVLVASKPGMRNGCVVGDPNRDLINDRWNEIYGDRV